MVSHLESQLVLITVAFQVLTFPELSSPFLYQDFCTKSKYNVHYMVLAHSSRQSHQGFCQVIYDVVKMNMYQFAAEAVV